MGDVLVTILFNAGIPKTQSGREYPLMLKGEQWYVDPDDATAHPKWFQLVV